MTMTKWGAALLAATALTTMTAAPVRAQDAETVATPEEAAAQLEFLKAQVDALQAQLDAVKKQAGIIAPAWKGMPEFSSGASGYKFKLSGEIQYDIGQVNNPGNRLTSTNIGFNGRSRRLLIGASGSLPGDFSYNFQFNLAEGIVDYEDVILEWAPHKLPLTFTAGYFYPFSSLDNMTSNRFVSFLERSQLNDAFSNGRRLGVAVTYVNKTNDLRVQLGAFNQGINGNTPFTYSATSTSSAVPAGGGTPVVTTTVATNNNGLFDRTGYQGSARVVWSPVFYGGQAHLAGSFQYRQFATDSRGLQYRARPFLNTTDQRLIGTGNIAASGDNIYGVELLYIHGPIHFQGEGQYLHVRGYRPGYRVDPPQALTGTAYPQNADFASGYGEVGYWLTGETRGYKNGKIDRTKILHPVDQGGYGGFQLVGRVDYINLTDQVGNTAANSFGLVNGGRQIGYLGALNYWPIDYVRFTAEYGHVDVRGGPSAATVVPVSGTIAAGRTYQTDVFALRAQIDF